MNIFDSFCLQCKHKKECYRSLEGYKASMNDCSLRVEANTLSKSYGFSSEELLEDMQSMSDITLEAFNSKDNPLWSIK